MKTKFRTIPYVAGGIIAVLLFSSTVRCLFTVIAQVLLLAVSTWKISAAVSKRMIRQTPQISSGGRGVLVTGCDTGFGHQTALALNRKGFTVYAACLNENGDGALQLKKKCDDPSRLHVIQMDVTSDSSVSGAFEKVSSYLASDRVQFYAVVNNAGILRPGQFEWGTFDYTVKSVVDVNVLGVARVTRTFLPLVRKNKGRIVNINSSSSRAAAPTLVTYSMSKHASLGLTEGLRREMKKFNVKVISIEPHVYGTRLATRNLLHDLIDEAWTGSTEEVKSSYGKIFLKKIKEFATLMSDRANPRTEDISDAVVTSLTSPEPELRVLCCSRFYRPILWMASNVFPTELQDLLYEKTLAETGAHQLYTE